MVVPPKEGSLPPILGVGHNEVLALFLSKRALLLPGGQRNVYRVYLSRANASELFAVKQVRLLNNFNALNLLFGKITVAIRIVDCPKVRRSF